MATEPLPPVFFSFFGCLSNSLRAFPSQESPPVDLSLRFLAQEKTIAFLFHTCPHRGGNCKCFHLHTVLLLSTDCKHSPCFLSTLTFFPLRVFTNTPVSTLSFLASKFRALTFRSMCLFTMVFNIFLVRTLPILF